MTGASRLLIFCTIVFLTCSCAITPGDTGADFESRAKLKHVISETKSPAGMILKNGQTVYSWGSTSRKFSVRSIRKSLLNALIGQAVDQNKIQLTQSLADLDVQDFAGTPLSAKERSATVRQLLSSTSGVYHPSANEPEFLKKQRPGRGTTPQPNFWYYNNWDFHALAWIYEKQTGQRIGSAFLNQIAKPIGMQDFDEKDVRYIQDPQITSIPSFEFSISTRDLARFGQLYLQNGIWNQQRILSQDWIRQSLTPVARTNHESVDFGYLWWVLKPETVQKKPYLDGQTFLAIGLGGYYLLVDPAHQLVIVHMIDESEYSKNPIQNHVHLNKLFEMVEFSIPLKSEHTVKE
jgi:CubicO group peptidase (beta-lactamase class C family)